MSDRKSIDRVQAFQDFLESNGTIKLVEIAEKLGVSPSKVRKWKSLDKWDDSLYSPKKKVVERSIQSVKKSTEKKKVERSTTKKKGSATKRKRGGQPGNTNAVGCAGGTGSPGTHGAYRTRFWDFLNENDRAMLEDMPKTQAELLVEQIHLYTAREKYLLDRIKDLKERARGGLVVLGVQKVTKKREFDKERNGEELFGEYFGNLSQDEKAMKTNYVSSTFTNTVSIDELLLKFEAELTKVQRGKTQAIAELNKIQEFTQKVKETQALIEIKRQQLALTTKKSLPTDEDVPIEISIVRKEKQASEVIVDV